MTTEQIVTIAVAVLAGGFATKLLDILRDARVGQLQKRRAEVDRAIKERDTAVRERDDARAETSWWTRWSRVLEESLAIHRRRMIDAPCLTPEDLPPYPARPDRDKP
ncbi:hypothetical protein [Herbiconiux sp. VKM Ac-2851]|uniref:hypothetical protein n=1 Tax=Herbiconiux sp. VKM Ac-2851 TaxID=2739025 RepID=UPI0015637F9F|nr:hypothetical protein [Herbiconiux sp. VKM Ac-2851]NQX36241.1 hypothetical protein [Herbiconiux sp. VKM Ac-2851]